MTAAARKRSSIVGLAIALTSITFTIGTASEAATTDASTAKGTRIKVVIPAAGRGSVAVTPRARRAIVAQTHSARGGHLRKVYAVAAPRPSLAQVQGLRFGPGTPLGDFEDNLAVKSSVALVMDEESQDVLFSRNSKVALPIASITKLMTSLVVLDAKLPMDEPITVTTDDLDTEKFSSSRLAVGTTLARRDMMHLALMASENRAAHALARNYPGGLEAFIAAMNAKALALGMTSTHFNDPTGLSSHNIASAEDLVKLVNAASYNETVREFSTDHNYSVPVGKRVLAFHNTNALVSSPAWDIVVQKTGYITEAGKCLVMKAVIEGRSVVIVLLDSFGKYTRLGDANRIKQWMEGQGATADPVVKVLKKTS